MSEAPQKQIIILGAGVTGLQTALSLLTQPSTSHYKITIIASHTPGDSSPEYTSPWAGGHWRSHATSAPGEREVAGWDARTYEFWSRLIWGKEKISPAVDGEGDLEKARMRMRIVGLGEKESRNYWGKQSSETKADGSGLWWKPIVSDFQILDLDAEREITTSTIQTVNYEHGKASGGIPPGAVFGIKYKSICIDVPNYLTWLFSTVTSLGAEVIKTTLDTSKGLPGIISAAKSTLILNSGNSIREDDIFALINCTGLLARKFLDEEEASKLYPIRGQTILVKGECALARTYTHLPAPYGDDELTYIISRPGSGTTILGGSKQVGNWDPEVDTQLSERILARVRDWGLAEELRTGEGRAFEVVSTQVGFRPGRKGGPRVEVEGEVDGVWVVHAYGHAGAGYQNSVGSAEKVVGLVSGL